jgi:spermidine synthase
MGVTFPLVIRWQQARAQEASGVAWLYSVNTLGGAAGAWLSAFVLMPTLGATGTLFVAAATNLLSASLAFRLAASACAQHSLEISVDAPKDSCTPRVLSAGAVTGLLFLSGLTALALEVLWVRALV